MTADLRTRIEAVMPDLDAVMAVVNKELQHRNRYHPDGRCRICGAYPEGDRKRMNKKVDHDMWCRYYVGPLTHEMHYERLNPSFGGSDYRCTCGGYFRQGGMAGRDGEPVCPNAHETYRDIDADPSAVGAPDA